MADTFYNRSKLWKRDIQFGSASSRKDAKFYFVSILDMNESKQKIEKLGKRCVMVTADLSKKDCLETGCL